MRHDEKRECGILAAVRLVTLPHQPRRVPCQHAEVGVDERKSLASATIVGPRTLGLHRTARHTLPTEAVWTDAALRRYYLWVLDLDHLYYCS